jgi:hypothetical protein
MAELRLFLGNLRTVVQSPYALAAYLAVVLAWVLISFRVNRNKQVLSHLQKLPEKDRLAALRMEMGVVTPTMGLSPTEYLVFVQKRYYFFGFSLLVLVIASLLGVSLYLASTRDHGTINVDITPAVPESSVKQ